MKRAAAFLAIAATLAMTAGPALAKSNYNQQWVKVQKQQLKLREQQFKLQQRQQAEILRQQQISARRVYPYNNRVTPYGVYGGGNYSTQARINNLRQQIGNTMDAGQKSILIRQLQYLEGRRSTPY
jgi:hypothetical protein